MTKKDIERIPKCYSKIYAIIIFAAILLMGIGYARVDSVNLLIDGNISSQLIKDVFISNATIQNNPQNNYINTYAQTTLNTDIQLSNTDLNSKVTLEITILNNANKDKIFNEIIYSSSLYTNNDITFEMVGLNKEETLKSGESRKTYLTFKYSDDYKNSNPSKPYNNNLSSVLQYNFVDEILETYNVTITGISFTPTSNELKAIKDRDYSINLQSNNYFLFVTMNNNNLTLNKDYTFSNGILTIKNVIGDINITAMSKDTYDFILSKDNISGTKSFNITNVTQMKNSENYINFSNIDTIKSLKLTIPYSGGNKNYTVACVLSVDGKTINTQNVTFTSGSSGKNVEASFSNLDITPKSKITITFDNSKTITQGNKTVKIESMQVSASF